MADLENAFTAPAFSLDDVAGIFYGVADPSAGGGSVAPKGSLYIQIPASGEPFLWIKYDTADTDWKKFEGKPRYAATCGYEGVATQLRFLEFNRGVASDDSPFVVAAPSEIRELSVAVAQSTTCTFTLYKNGVSFDTLVLTAAATGTKTGLSHSFATGDGLSVAITSGNAREIVFNTFIQVL